MRRARQRVATGTAGPTDSRAGRRARRGTGKAPRCSAANAGQARIGAGQPQPL